MINNINDSGVKQGEKRRRGGGNTRNLIFANKLAYKNQ